MEQHPLLTDNNSFSLIDQLDGNLSLSSHDSSLSELKPESLPQSSCIPVIVTHRPYVSKSLPYPRLPSVRKTVRRDNKALQAVTLPKMSSYNMRSLMPKCENFGIDMENRGCSLSFLTEIWQKSENKKHNLKIEELLELRGLQYISTPRPGNRRGGGAAIVVNTEKFSLSKLNVQIPKCLEVVWGLIKPLEITGKISKIIACCFYCPPKSTRKNLLIEHMTLTLQSLLNSFPNAGILISGDRNDLKMDRLLAIDSSLKQLVNKNTRGDKILDVVLTNMKPYYEEPEIVPPIEVDDPQKGGVPSDHSGVVVAPRTDAIKHTTKQRIYRTIRPITSSALNNLGQVFVNEPWDFLDPSLTPTNLTDLFEYYTSAILDTFCPTKVITVRPDGKPWFTENLKILRRQIHREYARKGKSLKYLNLRKIYDAKYEIEAKKYKNKIEDDVRNGDRASSYAALRKLGARPGEPSRNTFSLPAHSESNLSASQSAEKIADHFAAISQEYEPICINKFPPHLKQALSSPDLSVVPRLHEYEVYKKISKAKKPNSSVRGDLPKKVIQEFCCELSTPVTIIYNSILSTLEYPRQWVREYQIPIPKSHPPNTEDDLRNIAKTSFLSKCFESILSDWLMPLVEPYLDPCQYGMKGASINHYLFKLLKFIHKYLDLRNPHAVAVALIDLSKAFNRVSHQLVIEDLHDMHVPSWLLLILISYLSGRSMVLTYHGATSSPRHLPGSSTQGAFLGIFLFIIKYNGASLRPPIPRPMLELKCNKKFKSCISSSCDTHSKSMHALYIDDLSEAEAIELKEQLLPDPVQRPLPHSYHERTKHVLQPGSILQQRLEAVEAFTIKSKMKINDKKSKIMLFNKSRTHDFPPEFSFRNGEYLECIESTKLLGVHISTDLRWRENCYQMNKKAMAKMWLLRRLKKLNLDTNLILDFYLKEIRPVVEHGAPIWTSGLTKSQICDLERIQKTALKIIFGESYISYNVACTLANILPLEYRRSELCTKFAIKLFKSSKSQEFFTHVKKSVNTRSDKHLLVTQDRVNTKRCYNAPHNFLARIVNQNKEKIEKSQHSYRNKK